MKIKTFEFNPLGVNTYLLSDETNECVVIDAAFYYADEKTELLNYIIDNDYVVKHLINTHLHFDHLFGVNALASHFGLTLGYNRADEFLLNNISEQLKVFGIPGSNNDYKPRTGNWLDEGDVVEFGNQSLKVFHAPGHSPGSLLFYSEDSASVFSGDVLFRGSIGRTDLVGGNFEELVKSIQSKLFVMPNETKVYPGHGPATTIGYEKKNNPFVGIS